MSQSRVVGTIAGAALSVLVLSGCHGGGGPGASQTPSTTASASAFRSASAEPSPSASPTPSPASEAGPAVNIPVPEKPALADENSLEGLEAFTEWWFELANHALETGDTGPWLAVTDSECKNCQGLAQSINEAYADDGWAVGGSVHADKFGSAFRKNTEGSISSFVAITQDASTYYDNSGDVVSELPARNEELVREMIASHQDGEWLMLDFGSPNTGG